MELISIASVRYSETKIMEMKMKKPLLLCLTLLVVTGSILAACSGNEPDALAGDWELISFGLISNPTPAVPDVDTSVIFSLDDGTVTGNVGCNGFGGNYKVNGDTINFDSITSTLMACADPIMQQESAVFNVFTNSAAFKIDNNMLTITSADGNSVLIFNRK
jgi:heat shock protein HslJ